MQATKPTKLLFSSDSGNLLSKYIRNLIIWRKQVPIFSKFNILASPEILFKVGEALGNLIPDESDAVCLLANSGIPTGIIAGLSRSKPLYFFHRMGWQRGVGIQFIMPQPPPLLKMTVIDSHVRSGFTSRACYLELTESYQVKIDHMCAPIFFEPLFINRCPIEYRFLGDYKLVSSILSDIIGTAKESTQTLILNPESKFWAYIHDGFPLNEFKSRSPISKWKWLLRPTTGYPPFTLVSEKTRKLISNRIKSTDDGVWDFFQDSEFVKEICNVAGSKLKLEDYDYIVGIQALGLSLALALTYYNRDKFRGQLVYWLGQHGFLPEIRNWRNKKVLIVSLRIQFGTYLADVVSEIKNTGGVVNHVLVAVPDFKTKNLLNRFRQTSLLNLSRSGIEFLTLS